MKVGVWNECERGVEGEGGELDGERGIRAGRVFACFEDHGDLPAPRSPGDPDGDQGHLIALNISLIQHKERSHIHRWSDVFGELIFLTIEGW